MNLVSLVIINYNNKSYLKRCIDSIKDQTHKNMEIIFIDNESKDGSFEFMQEEYQNSDILLVENKVNNGYAGAANQGIKLSNGKYVMIINPDIIMEKDFIQKLHDYMESDVTIAAASGKLLKYDFEKDEKLDYIDSAGIVFYKNTRAADRGQNEKDLGQYDKVERVFGVCGAAPIYRREALEDIKVSGEYFDDDFFAYKEDVDLSWRLNLAGYKNMYFPKAVAYHGRGLGGSKGGIKAFINNRKSQSEFLRGISFRNHIMMLWKNDINDFKKKNRYLILKRQVSFLMYAVVFERFNFKYYKQAKDKKEKMLNKKIEFINKIGDKLVDINDILQ